VFITAEAVGGVWQYSLDVARGLSRLGHATILALTGPAATDEQHAAAAATPGLRLLETGLLLDWLTWDEAALRNAAEALAALAGQGGTDVVHLNMPALADLADFPAPVVAVHHSCIATRWDAVHGTPLPDQAGWRTELVRAGLHAADAVVTPTAAFGAAVQQRYGLPTPPRTVHSGRAPLAVTRGAAHDFVFTAGRLWDEGGNLWTLDAAAARIGVPVRAAGPVRGPSGPPIMFENIHCLGTLGETELARWLSAQPVFVSTALYEPSGLSVLDAAAAGCPLVLSDIPAFRELWDEVAIFVPPRDEQGFTRTIAELVADDFERAVLGRAARERAARYTPGAMAAQMAAVYRALLPAIPHPVLAWAREAA
jgi:glycosyltransferase involved in cell wall biosynthesis